MERVDLFWFDLVYGINMRRDLIWSTGISRNKINEDIYPLADKNLLGG